MTALELDGVTTGYTKAPVLRDVSVDVAAGEIVAVLGANGAGKTTLLRTASGGLHPWTGEVRLDGRPLGRSSAWARVDAGLAHVPEGRHTFGAMSVEDNLAVAALAGRRRTSPFGLTDVYELFPRLGERRAQRAGSLSGGEQQMLVIGRALVTGPSVLLIDELSAGLAPVTARGLVDSLGAVRDAGVAVLLVEQSPVLVADVVDRVYVLERGTVTRQGTLDAIGGIAALADVSLAGQSTTSAPESTARMSSRREAKPVRA